MTVIQNLECDGVLSAFSQMKKGKSMKLVHLFPASAVPLALAFFAVAPAFGQGGLDVFNPNVNGGIESMAVQSDGKILISGTFTRTDNFY
jgi:hypothetical protein